mmetsp:Transcript_14334/g.21209  ORF Transcript_14334/g.21209 Transcript_14334/m.21209 type:complete len:220 (-) Transcript_14334:124-783(-)
MTSLFARHFHFCGYIIMILARVRFGVVDYGLTGNAHVLDRFLSLFLLSIVVALLVVVIATALFIVCRTVGKGARISALLFIILGTVIFFKIALLGLMILISTFVALGQRLCIQIDILIPIILFKIQIIMITGVAMMIVVAVIIMNKNFFLFVHHFKIFVVPPTVQLVDIFILLKPRIRIFFKCLLMIAISSVVIFSVVVPFIIVAVTVALTTSLVVIVI